MSFRFGLDWVILFSNMQKKGKREKKGGGGGGCIWNSALFSAAVAERRERSSGSNCMLFCVSVGITHFWLVEAMRCLIKALPQKKNRLITREIMKVSEW